MTIRSLGGGAGLTPAQTAQIDQATADIAASKGSIYCVHAQKSGVAIAPNQRMGIPVASELFAAQLVDQSATPNSVGIYEVRHYVSGVGLSAPIITGMQMQTGQQIGGAPNPGVTYDEWGNGSVRSALTVWPAPLPVSRGDSIQINAIQNLAGKNVWFTLFFRVV